MRRISRSRMSRTYSGTGAATTRAVPRNQGEIAEVDGLRGIAIFAVMVHRLWPRDAVNRLSVAADAGWIGVDLFFVVSGFLITRILLETRGDPHYFRNFYARRVLRIFPLYYLFVGTLLVVFPLMGNSEYLEHAGSPAWYLTFLGNIPESLLNKDVPYWLAPVWSLAIEEQFYLTFPWIVLWLGPQRLGRFLVFLLLLAPIVRLVTMLTWPEQERIQYMFTLCRVDAIAAGCGVALIMRWRRAAALSDLAIVIACCAGAIAVIGDLDRTTAFGRVAGYSFVAIAFAAGLVAVMNGLGQWWTAPLRLSPVRYMGRLCFGLYLLHRPADTITTAIADRFDVEADRISWIPIKIAVALVLASGAWLVIEKPFLRLKRFFVSRRRPSAASVATLAALTLAIGCSALVSPGIAPDARASGDARDVDAGVIPEPDGALGVDGAVVATAEHLLYAQGQRHSPITADLAARLQQVAGGTSNVFAKIGDSITDTPSFAACFDGAVDYGSHGALADEVAYFKLGRIIGATPFSRVSESAHGGWTTSQVLDGEPSPLERELAAASPNIAVILLGTNDNRYGRTLEQFAGDLWTSVDHLLASGVVPLLSTLPPMLSYPEADARVPAFNDIVRAIAQGRQIPLVDLYGALVPLPNNGLSSDGIHPSVAPAGACQLTSEALGYGYNARNLLTLEALARIRAALAGTPSDGSLAVRAGQGTLVDPFRMPLPIADLGDTRAKPNAAACGSVSSGVVYEIELAAASTVEVKLIGNARVIQIEAGGTCVVDGDGSVQAMLPAGPARIVVRGSGEYMVLVR